MVTALKCSRVRRVMSINARQQKVQGLQLSTTPKHTAKLELCECALTVIADMMVANLVRNSTSA